MAVRRRTRRTRVDTFKAKDVVLEVERICNLPLPKNVADCAREIELLSSRQRDLSQRLLELSGESDRSLLLERKESSSSIEKVPVTSLDNDKKYTNDDGATEITPITPSKNIKQRSESEQKNISHLNTTNISERFSNVLHSRKSGGLESGMTSPLILALKKLQEEHRERKTIKKWILNLSSLFRSTDRDKSGTIDSAEYVTMVESLDVSEELKASLGLKFNDIDNNHSGRINIREFLDYFLILPTFNDELNLHANSNAPFLYETGLSRSQKWRLYLYNMVEDPNYNAVSKLVFCADLILAIVPTLVFLAQSVHPSRYINWSERNYIWVISTFYAIEYLCGLLTCKSSFRFVNNCWHMIDLVSFAFWMIYNTVLNPGPLNPMGFVIFRTLRIMKITTVFNLQTMQEDLNVYKDTIQLAYTSYETVARFMLSIIVFFSLLIYVFERGIFDEDTKIWVRDEDEGESPFSNFYNCVYFTAVTMTTVGYGDLSPKSAVGKLVALVSACCGVCNITLLINIIGECFEEVFREFVVRRGTKIAEQKRRFINRLIHSATKKATRGKVDLQMSTHIEVRDMMVTSGSLNDTQANEYSNSAQK